MVPGRFWDTELVLAQCGIGKVNATICTQMPIDLYRPRALIFSGAARVSFKEDVFPIIELGCLECHQPGGKGYQRSGLDMRTYEDLRGPTRAS